MVYTGLLLGALFGFILQRGRFCVTGAFRDVWIAHRTRWFVAFLIAIAVQSVGIAALQQFGVVELSFSELPWLAVTLGSLVFGVAIVAAGGCATGTWYRAGEGLVGSWIALVGYAVTAAIMKFGALKGVNTAVRGVTVPVTTLQDALGISVWWLVALLVAVVGYLAWRELSRPAVAVATLPPERTGLAHVLFEKRWHPFITAILIGLVAIAAYPLSFASGREGGLGITTPSANLVSYLVTGNGQRVDWGVMLVLGILVGSFAAAWLSGEFKWRVPDVTTVLRSAGGGIGMGIGASWAGGCTIGNSLVETSQFTAQGWLALVFTLLGVGIGTRLFLPVTRSSRARRPVLAPAVA